MKYTIEDIHQYLKYWYDTDSLSDFNMAIDSGYTKYAAYLIDSAGAINPETSTNPGIEKAIQKLLKGYDPKEDIKECFGNATVFVNTKTNEHAFIKNDYVDYLVRIQDMGSKDWVVSRERN